VSGTAKIRLGAGLLLLGELLALATHSSPRASSFLAFVAMGGGLMVIGALVGTWGIVQVGNQR